MTENDMKLQIPTNIPEMKLSPRSYFNLVAYHFSSALTASLCAECKFIYYRFGKDTKVVHFIGSVKPWHHQYTAQNDTLELTQGPGTALSCCRDSCF